MPNTNGDLQRKAGFFHSLGKVITEDANSAGNEKYKSAHNVRSNEVWMDSISYAPTSASASQYADGIIVKQVGSASGVVDLQNNFSSPLYLYPLTQTNYQTWFMDTGTPSAAVDGFVPSSEWVKPLIGPVDVPNSAGAPSTGYNLIMFRPNGINTISYDNAYYEVDYFAGLIRFQIGNTPVEGTGLGFTFNSSAFQLLTVDNATRKAYIQSTSTGGPRAIAWQYIGQKLNNYTFSGGTVSFEDSSTIGFTQSGVTYSAYVIPNSLTASVLNTGFSGGATAGYVLSNTGDGNFIWIPTTGGSASGSSGTSGTNGSSGTSGTSGSSGTSGTSGSSGTSGTSGSSGTSGTSGVSGSNGTSGTSGTSGSDGSSGTSGTSGTSGSSGTSGTSADTFTFSNDLIVSLSSGKTFGKYLNGQTIPATGKTTAQVIEMAIVESIAPTINLSSSTTIAFNQTSISNILNFSYVINSLGATAASVVLEWRRNNSGSWTNLTSSTSSTTYTHSLTDTNYNTQPFNYRYTVIDSQGASASAIKDITPASYVAPSISLSVTGSSLTSPETNSQREIGNVSSSLSGSITRNSSYVSITSYTLQYSLNNSTWTDIGSSVSFGPGSGSLTTITHNDTSLVASTVIYYRVKVIDDYQTYISNFITGGNNTVSFNYLIFYGPSSATPLNSTDVRALSSRRFATSGSFILNTGSTQVRFTAAMPNSFSIASSGGVIDQDALNADISGNYISGLQTFSVNDYYGNSHTYKIYTMVNATPYSGNHKHSITV